MRKILNLFIIGVMASGLIATSAAQGAGPAGGAPGAGHEGRAPGKGPGGGMRMMGKMSDEILAKLNLTKEQKAKIEALKKKNQAKMDELRKGFQQGGKGTPGNDGDRKAGMEKMRAAMKAQHEDLMKILTPAQQAQFEKEVKAMREKMMKERGGVGGPGGPGGEAPKNGKKGKGGGGGGL